MLEKQLLDMMNVGEGLSKGPASLRNSHQQQLKNFVQMMAADEAKKKEEAQWTIAEDKVMIMDIPIVQCPECGYQYEMTLAPDGIRIEFKHHHNPHCSKSMTKFYRPKGVFCREV